jgi:hypothetical protein
VGVPENGHAQDGERAVGEVEIGFFFPFYYNFYYE